MLKKTTLHRALFGATLTTLVSAPLAIVQAQEPPEPEIGEQEIEEVIVTGRFQSAAQSLTNERIELPFSADFLGFEVMARAGDPDIAAALRRVPGLTVVDGKFVYVRGLGERYSSVRINSAAVPSPELTRSVVPLDLLPTSIVESVKIQKSPSPDVPANFGGGDIDIRTKSIPDDFVASLNVGIGYNSTSDEDGLRSANSYGGLPTAIEQAIPTYQGDISITNIFRNLNFGGEGSRAEAESIHQDLISSLDRNVGITRESNDPDYSGEFALGNSWYFGDADDWRIGGLVTGDYSSKYRNENQSRESIGNPETRFVDIDRTIYEEKLVGSANVGIAYRTDHSVEASYYYLENDEEQVAVTQGFDQNFELADNRERIDYLTRLEQRELTLLQVQGSHRFIETPYATDTLERFDATGVTFDWFYSESEAETQIPNQTTFGGSSNLDPATGEPVTTQLNQAPTMGTFTFLELVDDMESWGGDISLPMDFGNTYAEFSGGWWGSKKARSYFGYNVNVNSAGTPTENRAGTPANVLTDDNLTVDNGFTIFLGQSTGNESYLAAQKVNAGYGMVDLTFNETWRISVGGRYEEYQQANAPINLLDFSGNSIDNLNEQLQDPDQRVAVIEDEVYWSGALTYIGYDFLGADDYQIRLSFGQTVVRPDLRELSDVQYVDPELFVRVQGNPLLETSPIDNFELRSEFFYNDGDNLTVSLFYKDIQQPDRADPRRRIGRQHPADLPQRGGGRGLRYRVRGAVYDAARVLPVGQRHAQ